jgi:hypothetical protein
MHASTARVEHGQPRLIPSDCALCAAGCTSGRGLPRNEREAVLELTGKVAGEKDGIPIVTAVIIRRCEFGPVPELRESVWADFDRPRFHCPFSDRRRPIVRHGGGWITATGHGQVRSRLADSTYEPQHFMAGAPQCPTAPVPGRYIKPLVEPTLPRRLLDGQLGPAVGPDYAQRSL